MILFAIPRFWFLHKIWARKRWARLALLALFGVEWAMFGRSLWSNSLAELGALGTITGTIAIALEAFATNLLFSSTASKWFNFQTYHHAKHRAA